MKRSCANYEEYRHVYYLETNKKHRPGAIHVFIWATVIFYLSHLSTPFSAYALTYDEKRKDEQKKNASEFMDEFMFASKGRHTELLRSHEFVSILGYDIPYRTTNELGSIAPFIVHKDISSETNRVIQDLAYLVATARNIEEATQLVIWIPDVTLPFGSATGPLEGALGIFPQAYSKASNTIKLASILINGETDKVHVISESGKIVDFGGNTVRDIVPLIPADATLEAYYSAMLAVHEVDGTLYRKFDNSSLFANTTLIKQVNGVHAGTDVNHLSADDITYRVISNDGEYTSPRVTKSQTSVERTSVQDYAHQHGIIGTLPIKLLRPNIIIPNRDNLR